jgi:glycolate oxidase FAD binding subunit
MGTQTSTGPPISDAKGARSELLKFIGEEHMHACSAKDAVDGVLPLMVIEPASQEEVASALRIATGAGLAVIPRGGATKMDWGNPPRRGELILSTQRLNRIVEHAWGDMTATVEAGCTFQHFQQTLSQHGQRLALDPLWPDQATIGGILATNDSGALRVRFGSLRDLIIGVTLALPDGTLAKSGGKVVKNVAGYDLPKLATGALGTLGIVTQAIFRLHPVPRESRTLSFSCPDNKTMNGLMLAIQDCNVVPTGVQARAAHNLPPEIDLRFEGTAAGCEAQIAQTLGMAAGVRRIESPAELWNACSILWNGAETSVVCKFTLLPADLGIYIDQIKKELEPRGMRWRLVAQAVGAGYLHVEVADYKILPDVLGPMRNQLESRGGSLVILRCPLAMKSKMDVWGSTGDALPLMKSIKAQFDPSGGLNPGRFVGGI